MHSIRTDFRFNLLCSASKLKRGVIEKKIAFGFPYSWIFLPPIFLLVFFFAVNHDGDIVRESFSVIFILHSLWYMPLVYIFMNLFSNVIFCVCSLLFLFSQPDVNITWITGHIHRSIVDKIDPTSEYVEMVKKIPYQLHWVTYFCEMWSEEFIYRAFNWSVKILLINRNEDPPPLFLTSKVEGWLIMSFFLENCLLDLFVVLDLDLGSILIDNSFFQSLKSWK
jgi:hypothetical protein